MRTWTLCSIALLALTACKDTTDPDHEPDVATLRLVVGTTNAQTVTVATGCAVTGGPISLTVNQARTVSATFLNASGQPDPVANDADEFQLAGGEGQADPVPSPSSITFTRSGPFTGSLTGTAATTAGSMFVSLLHPVEGHEDWGPCAVPITVSP
jgi:hypothetical protein